MRPLGWVEGNGVPEALDLLDSDHHAMSTQRLRTLCNQVTKYKCQLSLHRLSRRLRKRDKRSAKVEVRQLQHLFWAVLVVHLDLTLQHFLGRELYELV